jgi:hypothetical protein
VDAIAAGVAVVAVAVARDKTRHKGRPRAKAKEKARARAGDTARAEVKEKDRASGARDKAGDAAVVTASKPNTSRGLIRGRTPGRLRGPRRELSLLRRSTANRLRLRTLPRMPHRLSLLLCR